MTRALLTRPANTRISNNRSTRSSTRHSNIYDLIPDRNFKYLAFCLWRISSVLTSLSPSSHSFSFLPFVSVSVCLCLFLCLCLSLSVCLCVCVSLSLSLSCSLCLSVCLSVCMYVCNIRPALTTPTNLLKFGMKVGDH